MKKRLLLRCLARVAGSGYWISPLFARHVSSKPRGGVCLSCQGSLVNTLKEARPTAFMGVPRVWEKMQERMKSAGAKSSTVRRKVAAWAKDVGLQTNLTKMNQYVHVF